MKDFLKKFELYVGSVFISITTVVVIMNVFTRYFLKFTYFWTEEIAVGCFVWTIFLGTAAAYREKGLIGVEAIVVLLPEKIRNVVEFLTYILLTVLSGLMCLFNFSTYLSLFFDELFVKNIYLIFFSFNFSKNSFAPSINSFPK